MTRSLASHCAELRDADRAAGDRVLDPGHAAAGLALDGLGAEVQVEHRPGAEPVERRAAELLEQAPKATASSTADG